MQEQLTIETRERPKEPHHYVRPQFEVIPLDCEITAYAPVGDDPLF